MLQLHYQRLPSLEATLLISSRWSLWLLSLHLSSVSQLRRTKTMVVFFNIQAQLCFLNLLFVISGT